MRWTDLEISEALLAGEVEAECPSCHYRTVVDLEHRELCPVCGEAEIISPLLLDEIL